MYKHVHVLLRCMRVPLFFFTVNVCTVVVVVCHVYVLLRYSSVARVYPYYIIYNIYLRYTTSGPRTSTAVLLLLLLLVFRSPMQDGTTLK